MEAGHNKIGHAYSKMKCRERNLFLWDQTKFCMKIVFKSWWADRGNENDIEHWGGQPFFFLKKRKGNENMLLDALIIPVFYVIST